MTISNKIKTSIITFLILSICFIVFLIYPLFQEIKKNSKAIITQKTAITVLGAEIENLNKFKLFIKGNKEKLEKTEEMFLDQELPVDFINFLEKIAGESQIFLKVSYLTPKNDEDLWPALLVQVNCSGSFSNFLRFLEKLKSSNYLIEIQTLNVTKLTDAEGSNIRANLSFKVFTKEPTN